jgi:hypothetical protein
VPGASDSWLSDKRRAASQPWKKQSATLKKAAKNKINLKSQHRKNRKWKQ